MLHVERIFLCFGLVACLFRLFLLGILVIYVLIMMLMFALCSNLLAFVKNLFGFFGSRIKAFTSISTPLRLRSELLCQVLASSLLSHSPFFNSTLYLDS